MSGFWEGGAAAHAAGLKEEFEQQAAALRQQLKQLEDAAARRAIFDKIAELKRELTRKLDDIDRSLY